ncbi:MULTISPECIES: ABC transporter permease [Actinomadura]|uniref:Autoinducer 2 import system permease protein LsrC n=1 Tax=Actinomadura litoris TaxID=2678616 RepID=A0A7K1L2P5_9ACTN|nr:MULTISPECIES: ABC transporter permease [Actinomadura]MBT2208772.1 ABC transporter permease [Actinomadura sp. NEAU-AAG7]MUN38669.1 ABC transporter permease [Actinomadura litoris]
MAADHQSGVDDKVESTPRSEERAAPTALGRIPVLAVRAGRGEATSVLIATIVLVIFTSILHPDFLRPGQLLDTLQSSVYVGLLACGMAYLLSMREIDLSVGSTFGLTVIATGLMMKHGVPPWPAAGLGILLGAALGLGNALIVQYIAIPAIVATLATMSVYRGLALAMSGGQQVTEMPLESSFFTLLGGKTLGVPTSVWILVLVAVLLTLVLRFTPFGYRVRSIGSNPDAASFSGISIPRVRLQALVLVGLLAGVSGVLGLAFFTSGDPNIGTGFELQAIAAAIIGGTPLRGGSATVIGACLGAVLLSVVTSALQYFNIPANWSAFATGGVILAAVALDSLVRRRRRRDDALLGL